MTTLIARQQFTIDRLVNLREGPVRKRWSLAFSSIKRPHVRT